MDEPKKLSRIRTFAKDKELSEKAEHKNVKQNTAVSGEKESGKTTPIPKPPTRKPHPEAKPKPAKTAPAKLPPPPVKKQSTQKIVIPPAKKPETVPVHAIKLPPAPTKKPTPKKPFPDPKKSFVKKPPLKIPSTAIEEKVFEKQPKPVKKILDDTKIGGKHPRVKDLGPATIITDTRKSRFKLFPAITESIKSWIEESKKAYKQSKKPKYSVPETTRRKGVIQKATSITGASIVADHSLIHERIKRRKGEKEKEERETLSAPKPTPTKTWSAKTEPLYPLLEGQSPTNVVKHPRKSFLTANQEIVVTDLKNKPHNYAKNVATSILGKISRDEQPAAESSVNKVTITPPITGPAKQSPVTQPVEETPTEVDEEVWGEDQPQDHVAKTEEVTPENVDLDQTETVNEIIEPLATKTVTPITEETTTVSEIEPATEETVVVPTKAEPLIETTDMTLPKPPTSEDRWEEEVAEEEVAPEKSAEETANWETVSAKATTPEAEPETVWGEQTGAEMPPSPATEVAEQSPVTQPVEETPTEVDEEVWGEDQLQNYITETETVVPETVPPKIPEAEEAELPIVETNQLQETVPEATPSTDQTQTAIVEETVADDVNDQQNNVAVWGQGAQGQINPEQQTSPTSAATGMVEDGVNTEASAENNSAPVKRKRKISFRSILFLTDINVLVFYVFTIIVVITIIVMNIDFGNKVSLKSTPSTPVTEQPFIIEAPLKIVHVPNPNKTTILSAIADLKNDNQTEVTQLALASNKEKTILIQPSVLLQLLDIDVEANFAESITNLYFGSIRNEHPFIAMKVADNTISKGGMFIWEENMYNDLRPIFRLYLNPVEDVNVSAKFYDASLSGMELRLLEDNTGNEKLIYGFSGENVIIITTDSTAFAELMKINQ